LLFFAPRATWPWAIAKTAASAYAIPKRIGAGAMTLDDLLVRSGGVCEFCGANERLAGVEVAPLGPIVLCAVCRGDRPDSAGHWRCLEGAAWSQEPAVQYAVWRRLRSLDEAWATEARDAMMLLPEVQAVVDAPAAVEHRDSNGAVLAAGDTVVLIKDLPVKGGGFTAKRGTAVRSISLVADNAAHIEGRVEGQRIVILTEFVKKK
jgi:protein PhnA